jgi:S-adenosylmethionine synthetase
MMLAESKINTISDHISKALKDNHVSDDEFSLIMSELTKFSQIKDEIRTKIKTKIDDETKQSLIKQGKEKAVEHFKNMFGEKH